MAASKQPVSPVPIFTVIDSDGCITVLSWTKLDLATELHKEHCLPGARRRWRNGLCRGCARGPCRKHHAEIVIGERMV